MKIQNRKRSITIKIPRFATLLLQTEHILHMLRQLQITETPLHIKKYRSGLYLILF